MLFLHRPCGIRRKYLLKIIMDRKYINEEKTNWFNVVPNFGFNAVSICPSEIRRSEFPKYIWKNHIWGSWRTNAAKCKINYPSCIGLDLLLRYSDIAFFKMLLWSIYLFRTIFWCFQQWNVKEEQPQSRLLLNFHLLQESHFQISSWLELAE